MARFSNYLALIVFIGVALADEKQDKDAKDFQRVMKDFGGFSFNPNPFFCNSIPQYAPCAQPAIPICCGPCYQGVIAQQPPVGGAGTGVVPPPVPVPGTAAPAPPPTPAATVAPAPALTPAATGAPPPTPGATGAPPPTPGATAAPVPASTAPSAGTNTGNCPIGCPAGWTQWGFSDSCYLMPAQPLHSDTFWNQQAYCKSQEPTANIMVIDGLIEQALATAVSIQYFPSWASQLTNIYWWLGGYTDATNKWHFVDGTDQSSSILMTAANLIGGNENDTCIGADAKTLGLWQTFSCEAKTGAVICEMPKRPVCGAMGGNIPISPISLTVDSLKNLFPKMPEIPYLSSALSGLTSGGSGGGLTGAVSGALGGIFGKEKE